MASRAHQRKRPSAAKYEGGPTRVDQTRDFVERVAWTAIQAFAAAAVATGFDDWKLTLEVAGIAAGTAALKVLAAQNVGRGGGGDAIPGGVTKGDR